jgi:glyoxylase-like metal-dependent hydrolase (beta-lactamase superfamily II)
MTIKPEVMPFFDAATNTATYVVADPGSKQCAVIDSVLDFDAASGRTSTESADKVVTYIQSEGLTLARILETHVHADHLTAAPYLQDVLSGEIGIGEHVKAVQSVFNEVFNAKDVDPDGSQFDRLLQDGDTLSIGEIDGTVISTPGHTPACCTYVIGDAAFVGDTLFMPDSGTARCDFPGGDATTLYASIMKIFELPLETRVFICHDYKGQNRENFEWETTIAEQREKNIQINDSVTKEEFVKFRTDRDATLNMPKLILPAIQVNIRAGRFPSPEDNDVSYLKLPLNAI